MTIKSLFLGRAARVGVTLGAIYGIVARAVVSFEPQTHRIGDAIAPLFSVMSLGFIICVPFAMGYLTVKPAPPSPPWWFRVFAPWIPCLLVVLAAFVIAWEGLICIVLALPIMLFFSSLGGLFTVTAASESGATLPIILLLPYVVMPLEHGRVAPREIVETTTETTISAPANVVWRHVVSVDSIRPDEERPALFTAIGFPRPISATLSHEGVGGIRDATFQGGIHFVETVTRWEPERAIGFTIRAQPVPASTLDPHVTIGGPYFDVLTGTYELYPLSNGKVRLVLHSQHRVSTEFNLYAGWWSDRIMRSIQDNILDVIQRRCEGAAAAPS